MGAIRYAPHYCFELHKQRNNTKETQNLSKLEMYFFQKNPLISNFDIFFILFVLNNLYTNMHNPNKKLVNIVYSDISIAVGSQKKCIYMNLMQIL